MWVTFAEKGFIRSFSTGLSTFYHHEAVDNVDNFRQPAEEDTPGRKGA